VGASALVLDGSVLPGEPRNVRPGNADIGQLTVAEVRQLVDCGSVPLPGSIKVNDCSKHRRILSFRPVGRFMKGKIAIDVAVQKFQYCGAANLKSHGFGNKLVRNQPLFGRDH
jgi:hypothetical protein